VVEKRVRSWYCEGQALHKKYEDYDSDCETDLDDDDHKVFLIPPMPVQNQTRQLTPPAIALAHGNKFVKKPISKSNSGRQTQLTTNMKRPATKWLIPVNHPLKIVWDVLMVVLSIYNAYATHAAIHRCKGVILVRFLRDFGHFRAAWRHQNNNHDNMGGETADLTMYEDEDDNERQEAW
jgi:hypothetical protein